MTGTGGGRVNVHASVNKHCGFVAVQFTAPEQLLFSSLVLKALSCCGKNLLSEERRKQRSVRNKTWKMP